LRAGAAHAADTTGPGKDHGGVAATTFRMRLGDPSRVTSAATMYLARLLRFLTGTVASFQCMMFIFYIHMPSCT
jgi:hypothetical protein